ncbi:hypothetical protein BZA77DRAFT_306259 [Pyronema omphalodes]|nr:hypothetical protein BZA77DRAFT_306259 [Pyronema omphalodes]
MAPPPSSLNPTQIYGPTKHPQLEYLPNNLILYHRDRIPPHFSLSHGIPTIYDEFGVELPYITPPIRTKAMNDQSSAAPHKCPEHHVHRFRLNGRACYCNTEGMEKAEGHNEYKCIYECPGVTMGPGKTGGAGRQKKCTKNDGVKDSKLGCGRISCAYERRNWVKGPRCIPENTAPTFNQMVLGEKIEECLNCTRKAWLWCAEEDCMTRLCPNCVMEECTRDTNVVVRERHAGISEEETRMMEEEEQLRREWERKQELGEGAKQDSNQRAMIWERQQGEVEGQQREFSRYQRKGSFKWSPGMEGRLSSGGYF